jgi:hypothetical protein
MSQESDEIKLLRAILDKLDKVERLQALQAVKGTEKEQDKVELLDSLGFRPVEIARLLNKTPENVGVVLSNIRKKKAPASVKPTQQPATQTVVVSPPAQL